MLNSINALLGGLVDALKAGKAQEDLDPLAEVTGVMASLVVGSLAFGFFAAPLGIGAFVGFSAVLGFGFASIMSVTVGALVGDFVTKNFNSIVSVFVEGQFHRRR